MLTNLRGELTVPYQSRFKDLEMFEAVARFLHMSSSEEMDELKDSFFPSVLCSAVKVYSFIPHYSVIIVMQLNRVYDKLKSDFSKSNVTEILECDL